MLSFCSWDFKRCIEMLLGIAACEGSNPVFSIKMGVSC